MHGTATRLNQILPVDSSLLSDGSLQWQAQLLANYSGHIFVSRSVDNGPAYLMQAVVESSLAVLALRARVADLESQNSSLTSENKRLETEMEQMEDEHREERRKILQSSQDHGSKSNFPTTISGNTAASSQVVPHYSHRPPANSHHTHKNPKSSVSSSPPNGNQRFPLNDDDDLALAEQMQLDILDSDRQSADVAVRAQRQFDEEDRFLRAQREELATHAQGQFQCGICLDDQPEDYIARLDSCMHRFCRDCIRSYVGSRLDENRYPILCPVCTTEEVKGDPSGE